MWLAALPVLAVVLNGTGAEAPAMQHVSARLAESKARENATLRTYTVLRHYVLTTDHGRSAEMMVRLTYAAPGQKHFEVLWERGSDVIQKRVFRRLLDAEEKAARNDAHLTAENYDFRLESSGLLNGRRCYILQITPKAHRRYLVRGRVWVDAEDFAVVRVEGAPAENYSFWIRSTRLVQAYRKVGRFWLPDTNESDSEVRLFGAAHLSIRNLDYHINPPQGENRAEAAGPRPLLE